ncbi:MAG: hypothetical protein BWZ02_02383 [Lentisphaerae bacterium ADurb.BinA184]|nr:MAG: hypothetical protein BWZ02_02383 [Lentisphaerae bacterium ADurb.BinA184]
MRSTICSTVTASPSRAGARVSSMNSEPSCSQASAVVNRTSPASPPPAIVMRCSRASTSRSARSGLTVTVFPPTFRSRVTGPASTSGSPLRPRGHFSALPVTRMLSGKPSPLRSTSLPQAASRFPLCMTGVNGHSTFPASPSDVFHHGKAWASSLRTSLPSPAFSAVPSLSTTSASHGYSPGTSSGNCTSSTNMCWYLRLARVSLSVAPPASFTTRRAATASSRRGKSMMSVRNSTIERTGFSTAVADTTAGSGKVRFSHAFSIAGSNGKWTWKTSSPAAVTVARYVYRGAIRLLSAGASSASGGATASSSLYNVRAPAGTTTESFRSNRASPAAVPTRTETSKVASPAPGLTSSYSAAARPSMMPRGLPARTNGTPSPSVISG